MGWNRVLPKIGIPFVTCRILFDTSPTEAKLEMPSVAITRNVI
jgi:hypothetical protein